MGLEPRSASTRVMGSFLRDVMTLNRSARSFRSSGPTRRLRTGCRMSSRNANGEELASAPDTLVDVLLIPADEERAVAAELLGFEAIPVPR